MRATTARFRAPRATPGRLDAAARAASLLDAARYSFLPQERKAVLQAAFRAERDALKAAHWA